MVSKLPMIGGRELPALVSCGGVRLVHHLVPAVRGLFRRRRGVLRAGRVHGVAAEHRLRHRI